MIASTSAAELDDSAPAATPLDRVPAHTFGETDWVALALKNAAAYLEPAIASGRPYRIANAVRAIAHAPSHGQVDEVVAAVCDHLLAEAYSNRNSRMISAVADARAVVRTVLEDINERSARRALEPGLLRETIDGFVRVAGLSDKRLADRLDAVGDFTARIAVAMHLPGTMVVDAECAARLHDIGMLSAPKERSVKAHALAGETFVLASPSLAHLAPLVRAHHERFDGTGVPDGLRGDEIPLEARIIAVAAAFVELVTDTARQKALLPDDACAELIADSGSKFDPDVINAALDLLQYRHRAHRSA